MSFIQIIEYQTTRPEEMHTLMDEWITKTEGRRTATHVVVGRDRDRANTYIAFVSFPSYDDGMRNSELPDTREFSARVMALCDGEPIFRNLDVVAEHNLDQHVTNMLG